MLTITRALKTYHAWLMLAIGLLASVFSALHVKQDLEVDAAERFHFTSEQVALKIQERLNTYALILKGGAGFFTGSDSIERHEWRSYVEKLRAHESISGVQGIGFAKIVPSEQLAAHVAGIRAEGFPEYSVWPSGERAVYTAIIYLEPFDDRNQRAFGYDMFSEPVRRNAMERARDTGRAALSGKVELVQETGEEVQAGTLMYFPVYRNGAAVNTVEQRRSALIGWSYSAYRMNNLMDGILPNWTTNEGKLVDLHIYDGSQAKADNLLFDSRPDGVHHPGSLFNHKETIEFNGNQWLLEFEAIAGADTISYVSAWATLIGGFALSGLLFGLMLSLVNTRAKANLIADTLTKEIQQGEQRIRNMSDAAGAYLWEIDANMVYTYISELSLNAKGYLPTELIGHTPMEFMPPEDVGPTGEIVRKSIADRAPFVLQHRNVTRSGQILWEEVRGNVFVDDAGNVVGLRGSGVNITARKQAEQAVQLAASVFSTAREGIMITDTGGIIIDVNQAFTRITGYSRDEAIGNNPRMLSSGRHDPEFYAAMWRDLNEKGHWQDEIWNRRKNGEVYAEMQTITTVRDPEGNVRQYVSLFSDITSLKEHQRQLEHIAHYDALTRLPNRVLLADRLHQAMVQARRRKNVLAVAFLDLDGFKAINDTHGHDAGDALLIALSARMKNCLRAGDTLARFGGDEFVAVLADLPDVEDCVPMLDRLLAATTEPVPIGELTVQVSASLGVTFYPQAEELDADQLQRQADQAMYQAKLAGKSRYHVFDAAHDRSLRGHHESIEDIRRGLLGREFRLYYQPKINMRSGAVVGAEALIRWQHPQKGLLAPAAYLPVIEDHPLAIEIGEWVIESALTQMETWRAAGLELPVSVNVGAQQLHQPDFVQRLHALLKAHPTFRPGDLEIEVLETSALEDIARISKVIEACRALGVAFALDDFGTGYSSLTYLKRLSVSVLKIDQSFVRDMLSDPDDLAILEGVIGLASAFRRTAIAEGVETIEHGEMLLQLGCDLAQGYGIARPMPADQMPGWAAVWRTPPAWASYLQISHDNRPLLHAAVEHRAWIMAAEHYLKGERAAPLPQDPRECRFGLWLDVERMVGRGDQPDFNAVVTLHQQVHALADELCALHTDGSTTESLARLSELYRLHDALLEQMKTLGTSR